MNWREECKARTAKENELRKRLSPLKKQATAIEKEIVEVGATTPVEIIVSEIAKELELHCRQENLYRYGFYKKTRRGGYRTDPEYVFEYRKDGRKLLYYNTKEDAYKVLPPTTEEIIELLFTGELRYIPPYTTIAWGEWEEGKKKRK